MLSLPQPLQLKMTIVNLDEDRITKLTLLYFYTSWVVKEKQKEKSVYQQLQPLNLASSLVSCGLDI